MSDSTKLDLDLTAVFTKLDAYEARLVKIEQGYIDVGKAAKSSSDATSKSFAPIGDSANDAADEIKKLGNEYTKLKGTADTLRGALKNATDPRAIQVYARELKNAERGLKELENAGKAAGVNLKKMGKEGSLAADLISQAFGAITKATVILAIIDQVVKLSKAAVSLSEATNKASLQFEAFTGSADKAKGIVADLNAFAQKKLLNTEDVFQAGKGLLAFGENADNLTPVLSRIADLSAATGKNFNELTVIYGKARTSGVLYAEDINQLVDAGIPIIQEFAKQLGVSESQVKKLASEGKISFEELQLAFFNLTKEGSKFAGQAEINAKTIGGAWQGLLNELKPITEAVGNSLRNFTVGLLRDLKNLVGDIKGLFGSEADPKVDITIDYSGRDKAEQAKDDLFELTRLEEAAAKKRKELSAGSAKEQAALAKEVARLRIEAMRDGEAKELAQEDLRNKELLSQLKKYGIDSVDAVAQHEANVTKIKVKYFLERFEAQQKAIEDEKQALQNGFDELIGIEKQGEEKRIAALKVNAEARKNASEFSQESFKEAELAARQLFFSKKRSAEEIDRFEKDVAKARAVFQLKIQQEELQRSIDFDVSLTEAEKATLRKRIENIQTEIGQISSGLGEKGDNKGPKSLIELLGFKEGGEEDKALNLAVDKVKTAIDDITQARIEAANAAREVADQQVQDAQDALDKELQLKKDGFSNNSDLRQKDLNDAKQAQAQAIEEQRKAARQKALIDTASQISSLVLAGAELFAAHASVPFVGIALAVAGIAAMISTITRLKATAKGTAFREGGGGWLKGDSFVEGKSHRDGGNHIEVEKGEFMAIGEDGGKKRLQVVRREKASEYFNLLDAANRGDKKALAQYAYALSDSPRVNRKAIQKRVFSEVPESKDQTAEQIRVIVKEILGEMKKGSKKPYSPDGKTIIKGNKTIHIK